MRPTLNQLPRKHEAQPAWDLVRLFPEQGNWSEEEYLALPSNHLVELVDGCLEFPPMPTTSHQIIVNLLVSLLNAFAGGKLGLALPFPLPVRLWHGMIREPDVVFMLFKNKERMHEECWDGADLAMEVVSRDPKSRNRDLITKRKQYARARIQEYWIVDPKLSQITVLHLKGKAYRPAGVFKSGDRASSVLLEGFSVDVDQVFACMKESRA